MQCPHCSVELQEHEASACLDAWVAVAIMSGVETMNFQEKSECYWRFETPEGKVMLVDSKIRFLPRWSPSTRIADAWEVLDKFYRFEVGTDGMIYLCDIAHEPKKKYLASAETAPLAICRAALKSKG